jgi:hypothetical protein
VIVSGDALDLRGNTFRLPVRYGRFGERKRCPARKGGVLRLETPVPYDAHLERAVEQPSRARAVLFLVDACWSKRWKLAVTVTEVGRDGDEWLVSFVRGEHPDVVAAPRLLRASAPNPPVCQGTLRLKNGKTVACKTAFPDTDYLTGRPVEVCPRCGTRRPPVTVQDSGYTSRKSSAMRGEAEAVPEDVQQRYGEIAAERDATARARQRERALAAINEIAQHASGRDRKRLRAAANQIRALDDHSTGQAA